MADGPPTTWPEWERVGGESSISLLHLFLSHINLKKKLSWEIGNGIFSFAPLFGNLNSGEVAGGREPMASRP